MMLSTVLSVENEWPGKGKNEQTNKKSVSYPDLNPSQSILKPNFERLNISVNNAYSLI